MQLPSELKIAIDNNAFCAIATSIDENIIQNHFMWVDYKENNILINKAKVTKWGFKVGEVLLFFSKVD